MQHLARNVHSSEHRVADVTAGSDENKDLSTVNHDNFSGFAESGATPETTRLATVVVPA